MPTSRSCLVVGRGRAGSAFDAALERVGWSSSLVSGHAVARGDATVLRPVESSALILLAVPDDGIGGVAAALPATAGVVAHVSGSLGLEVLGSHGRTGSIHPLMSLPDRDVGAARLLDSCTFAIDGDPLMGSVVDDLGGRSIHIRPEQRGLYHATAAIAANHVTALCAQIERFAAELGVPADAYWQLLRTTVDNVEAVGAGAALTGPAARGDWTTVERHLASIPDPDDRRLYLALCQAAARLAGRALPPELHLENP